MYRKIIAAYFENFTNHKNKLGALSVGFLNV
jgi:hypothetical protein